MIKQLAITIASGHLRYFQLKWQISLSLFRHLLLGSKRYSRLELATLRPKLLRIRNAKHLALQWTKMPRLRSPRFLCFTLDSPHLASVSRGWGRAICIFQFPAGSISLPAPRINSPEDVKYTRARVSILPSSRGRERDRKRTFKSSTRTRNFKNAPGLACTRKDKAIN